MLGLKLIHVSKRGLRQHKKCIYEWHWNCFLGILKALCIGNTALINERWYKVWDEIIYPFPNNDGTVEFGEWISNFIPQFTGHVISYPYWDLSLNHISKRSTLQYTLNTTLETCENECHFRTPFIYECINSWNGSLELPATQWTSSSDHFIKIKFIFNKKLLNSAAF